MNATEREAKSIEERPIPYCVYRKHEHVRYLITVVPIAILLTLAVILLAVWQESNNYWVSQTIRVQFDDSTGLEYYSGCYDLDVDVTHNKRKNYNSFHENNNSAIFGYCKENRQWILFKDDDAVKGEHLSPCDVTVSYNKVRSAIVFIWFQLITSYLLYLKILIYYNKYISVTAFDNCFYT